MNFVYVLLPNCHLAQKQPSSGGSFLWEGDIYVYFWISFTQMKCLCHLLLFA